METIVRGRGYCHHLMMLVCEEHDLLASGLEHFVSLR